MKLISLLLSASLLPALAAPAAELIVHEWGTFTTLSGSDGVQLDGLHREEETLPPFVFRQQLGVSKGLSRVKGVTVKMETPVLYFYADAATPVEVRVGFEGGSISEWYPQQSAGEPHSLALDLTQPYRGAITWKADVLAPDIQVRPTPDPRQVTPLWEAPRRTGANLVQGEFGEIEHYLFYRGLGNFQSPLLTRFDAHELLYVENRGADTIPFAFVYDKDPEDQVRITWLDDIRPGESEVVNAVHLAGSASDIERPLRAAFEQALTGEGLYADEASAMIDTWWHSYFQKPGLRVFWIVPRPFTDAILPIGIDPEPNELVRVMVGRSEVLSPAFEHELLSADGAEENPYAADRFAPAYQARVKALNPEAR